MDMLKIAFSALGTLIALFLFTKIMGNREMAQLSMFDFISSITVGSIAGEMAVMSTDSFIEPLIAMTVFTVITALVSFLTCKSVVLRRFIEGESMLLYQNGQIYEKNLLKAKLDVDEFLTACRLEGYYNLEDIHTIFLEPSGMISILPMVAKRPVNPADLNLTPAQEIPLLNVILDGHIMYKNLSTSGKDDKWLQNQLKTNGVKNINDILLATFDASSDTLNIYRKFHRKMMHDIYE